MPALRLWVWTLALTAFASRAQEPNDEGRYWLKQGGGYPVCRAFLDNFNAFPGDEPPMVCEQKVHPSHPEFDLPLWEELAIARNLKLIYEAEGLLRKFTPTGTVSPTFERWEQDFLARVNSGAATPRLRKTTILLAGESETLISYEPITNECTAELVRDGVGGGPGGYVFVLRASSGELEPFGGFIASQLRTDVLIYRGKYPYLMSANPDFEVVGERRVVDGELANDLRPIYRIGLNVLLSREPISDRYVVDKRCYVGVDRPAIP